MFDFGYRKDIQGNQRLASSAKRQAHRANESLSDLEATVDRLALTCRALWELLQAKTGLTEDDLAAKVAELSGEQEDEQAAGKAAAAPRRCPACKRASNARHVNCIYCGETLPENTHFDRL